MKILVVHRQASVLAQVKSSLSANEAVVRHFNSGLDGLLAVRVEKFDLIICGTDLPVITGFELIRSLRTHSINDKTPVIFIADEINEKEKYLSNALGVAGVVLSQEVSSELKALVSATQN